MPPPLETNKGTKNTSKQETQRRGDSKQDKKDKKAVFHGLSGGKGTGESSTDDETDEDKLSIRDVNKTKNNSYNGDGSIQEDSESIHERSQVIFQEGGGGQGATSDDSQDQTDQGSK